jgi:hypothetical protein
MILLKVYKNIDKSNQHRTYKLSNNFYNSIRNQLLNTCTIISENENGELIDDNV